MRVVYVSSLTHGGPLSHVRDLAPAMAAAGVDVHVVVASETLAAEFRDLGVEASVAAMRHKLDARGAAQAWPALAGADVVHTHDRRAGLLARPQARLRGAASVHTLHGVPEELCVRVGRRRTSPFRPASRALGSPGSLHGIVRIEALLTYLGTVIVPSHALAAFLAQYGFPQRRMHVIPYGVEPQPIEPHAVHEPAVFGTAANLEYHKGIDDPARRGGARSRHRFSSRSTATARRAGARRPRPPGSGSTRASTASIPSSGRRSASSTSSSCRRAATTCRSRSSRRWRTRCR